MAKVPFYAELKELLRHFGPGEVVETRPVRKFVAAWIGNAFAHGALSIGMVWRTDSIDSLIGWLDAGDIVAKIVLGAIFVLVPVGSAWVISIASKDVTAIVLARRGTVYALTLWGIGGAVVGVGA